MIGFIYIMSNPAYPESIKIGQTGKDPEERRKDLGSTGVLEDFVLEYRALSEDYESLEKEVHKSLSESRVRADREFFRVSVPEAINTIREIAGDRIETDKVFYVSPEELIRIAEEKIRIEEERLREIDEKEEERLREIDEKRKKVRLPILDEWGGKPIEVVEVFVKKGDYVTASQKIIEISTNKIVTPMPAILNGEVYEVEVKVGDRISGGDIILSLEDNVNEDDQEFEIIADWEKSIKRRHEIELLNTEKKNARIAEEKQNLINYNKPYRKIIRALILPFKIALYPLWWITAENNSVRMGLLKFLLFLPIIGLYGLVSLVVFGYIVGY
jgi:biotin carboxyl carrier protein